MFVTGFANADKCRQMGLLHHCFISQLKTGFYSVLYIQMYMFYLHNNSYFKKKLMFSWKSLQFNVQSVMSLHQSVYHETVKTVKNKTKKKNNTSKQP